MIHFAERKKRMGKIEEKEKFEDVSAHGSEVTLFKAHRKCLSLQEEKNSIQK